MAEWVDFTFLNDLDPSSFKNIKHVSGCVHFIFSLILGVLIDSLHADKIYPYNFSCFALVLQLLQLLHPGSLWVPVQPTIHRPAAARPLRVSPCSAPSSDPNRSPDPADPYLMLSFLFPGKNKYAGGNSVCPRPTPTWQKGIGDFFGGPPRKPEKENQRPQEAEDEEEEAGGSGMSKAARKYVLQSREQF